MKINRAIIGAPMGVLCMGASSVIPSANAVPVTSEIVLLADTSGSVDATDFNLQKNGYAAAFQSAAVQNAIAQHGPIAVTLVYWSDGQQIAVPWTLISDATSANDFASAIVAAPRTMSGSTQMSAAMLYGAGLVVNNGYEGTHVIMDVSGDGAQRDGILDEPSIQSARASALAGGFTQINALWINDRDYFGNDPNDMVNAFAYGTTNVLGGTGAFQLLAQDFSEFEVAVTEKIGREVNPSVPDGGTTVALFGVGILGLGFFRKMLV